MKAGEVANIISGELQGDADFQIKGFAGLEDSAENEITFIQEEKYLPLLEKSLSMCVIAPFNLKNRIQKKTVIYVNDPCFSYILLINKVIPDKTFKSGIHPSAIIGKNVKIGKDVFIGPYSIIGDNTEIGDKSVIIGQCYIGNNSKIGENTRIHSNVAVYDDICIGKRVIIHSGVVIGCDGFGYIQRQCKHIKIPHLGAVNIEDDVEIGANTAIDRGKFKNTNIGKGTKIDNLVHIGHNVTVGENCLIVAQAALGGSSKIGKEVIIAGQVGITNGIEVGDRTIIAAQSGVTKSLPSSGVFWGTPARPLSETKEQLVLMNQLKDMKKKISNLEKKINMDNKK
ncbi:MAG: UDP-3-O-(3-hydroxymyristoyl)glucosamine N-acyltransferase [bacterium]|nr:UDP-3-O-(3-hydroxymyristoyl)glucosamine N-acyltransferase [bacterium]